ncbi:MAG: PmoA family protein [Planctomycetaceae bacterium]
MCVRALFIALVTANTQCLAQDDSFRPERCEVIPLPDQQVSLRVDGVEKTRWHFGKQYPRPFFFPFNGPSGTSLTRMGHPGAPDHDHHRSVWFAFHDVNGFSFWADTAGTQVRQKQWYRYRDGDTEAVMASVTGWYDPDGNELMEQDVIAAIIPMADGEHALELQITMRPPDGAETVALGKTNFGFLAVRVAKTISAHFGGGELKNSEGLVGEEAIFGKRARWMDYSGPITAGSGTDRSVVTEGMTFFDHPTNPRYPTFWHVRQDGWMGAAFCLDTGYTITNEAPLTLRYLLHAHSGAYDSAKAERVHQQFGGRTAFRLRRAGPGESHLHFQVERQ